MKLPDYMLAQRRWMVRPQSGERAKLPQAAYESCPADYEGDPDKWQYAWTTPQVLATIEQAFEYWGDNEADIAGLCYVLHPLGNEGETLRLICFDFDHCFIEVKTLDDSGEPVTTKVLDPEVARFVEELDSFTEISLLRNGLHVFVFVFCEIFRNIVHFPIGDCKVDIFCSHQMAVTGDVFEGHETLNTISAEVLDRFPRRTNVDKDNSDLPDFWNESNDGLRSDHKYLVDRMAEWGPCIDDQRGGREMFKAACYLARHGVTGWDAFNFMANVEQIPPFADKELQHKVECAWFATHAESEFGVDGLSVFDAFPVEEEESNAKRKRLRLKYGVITAKELQNVKSPEFLIEKLFIDKACLFIGGREKTFKTGLAFDLAISLATGTPFLDTFPVASKRRVVVFTAEIGESAIKLLENRICRQKGIEPGHPELFFSATLPEFQVDKYGKHDPKGRAELKEYLQEEGVEVAVFDPLYFFLLGTSPGDMNAVGGILRNISTICKECDVWPIICHHARKDSTKDYQPMTLGDMSGSGPPAFARQWLLLSHAELFENGRASLYLRAGGSSQGDRGLWRVGIDEGIPDEITDRRWDLTVSSEDDHESHDDARENVLEALRYFSGVPQTVNSIVEYTGLGVSVARDALRELLNEQQADLLNSKYQIKG